MNHSVNFPTLCNSDAMRNKHQFTCSFVSMRLQENLLFSSSVLPESCSTQLPTEGNFRNASWYRESSPARSDSLRSLSVFPCHKNGGFSFDRISCADPSTTAIKTSMTARIPRRNFEILQEKLAYRFIGSICWSLFSRRDAHQ